MAGRRRKSKLIGIIIALIIVVAIGLVLRFVVYDKAKAKVTSAIASKILEEQLPEGVSAEQVEQVQQIYNSMSENDQDIVNRIVEEKLNAKTVSEVGGYLKNNDKEGLKEYVKDSFSDQDIQEIKDLYNKYKP